MKDLKILVMFIAVIGAWNAMACSIQVDDNYTKNLLIAHGVSFNDLSLPSVSGVSVTGFDRSFEGDDGGGSCPDYMIQTGRVSMAHSPSVTSHCTYAVTVTVRNYMGEDLPDGPIEEVIFSDAVAACSTSRTALRVQRQIRIKPKKIYVIRREFPFKLMTNLR